jgi:hypothetical protein
MANRSDWNSTLPRHIKRMLALQPFKDAHERGEAVRAWIDAHAHAKRARNKMLSARTNVSRSDDAVTE